MFIPTDEELKRFRDSDILISSFPRSGNSWTRFLLADVILQLHGITTETDLPFTEWVIPDIHTELLTEEPPLNLPFRFIKTHYKYETFLNFRTVFIFRNPADVLCSYYHHHLTLERFGNNPPTLDEFCKGNEKRGWNPLEDYCSHLKSYLAFKHGSPDKVYFLSYESLSRSPVESLVDVTSFCGIDADYSTCKRAVSNHEFGKHKALEEICRQNASQLGVEMPISFREGRLNSSLKEMSGSTHSLIEHQAVPLYQQAIEIEARQGKSEINSDSISLYRRGFQTWLNTRAVSLKEVSKEFKAPENLIDLSLKTKYQSAKIRQLNIMLCKSEKELAKAQAIEQQLHSTWADLQTVREELHHSYEKLQSTQEELCSTKEDLSIAKRELSSTREEMSSVREELSLTKQELWITKGEINHSREEAYSELDQLSKQAAQKQLESQQKSIKIQQLRSRVKEREATIQSLNERLEKARETIQSMKRSKFWKLQSFWSRIRSSL